MQEPWAMGHPEEGILYIDEIDRLWIPCYWCMKHITSWYGGSNDQEVRDMQTHNARNAGYAKHDFHD